MKTGKLTPYQAKLLADIAEGRRTVEPRSLNGDALPRAAAVWRRSTEVLCKRGLLVRHAGGRVSIPVAETLPDGAFIESVRGKSAAYARAEHLRNLGREVIVLHKSGPHHTVRVSAVKGAAS